jgi:hypothetical protein
MSKKLKVGFFVEAGSGKPYLVSFDKGIKSVDVGRIDIDSIFRAYTFDDDRARNTLKDRMLDDAIGSSLCSAKLADALTTGKNVTKDHAYVYTMLWVVFSIDFLKGPYEDNFNIKDHLNRAIFRSLYDGNDAKSDDRS